MIALIDYDAGNMKSVEKALTYLGKEVCVTRNRDQILKADQVILPGVGAFGNAMEKIDIYDLRKTIYEVVSEEKPFLGICLGLQLFFEESDEAPGIKGLGILKGKVNKIPEMDNLKIPHMGWNSLEFHGESRLFKNVQNHSYVYFVHSYYLQAQDETIVKATSDYGVRIHAAVEKGSVFACQFHPEKSSDIGLEILKNFSDL